MKKESRNMLKGLWATVSRGRGRWRFMDSNVIQPLQESRKNEIEVLTVIISRRNKQITGEQTHPLSFVLTKQIE